MAKYIKNFELEYSHQARTLDPEYVSEDPSNNENIICTKLNESGWEITGKICEDYYHWVNDFEAKHEKYGWIKGNFEDIVTASSKKAYEHFIKNHPYREWDYWDI